MVKIQLITCDECSQPSSREREGSYFCIDHIVGSCVWCNLHEELVFVDEATYMPPFGGWVCDECVGFNATKEAGEL